MAYATSVPASIAVHRETRERPTEHDRQERVLVIVHTRVVLKTEKVHVAKPCYSSTLRYLYNTERDRPDLVGLLDAVHPPHLWSVSAPIPYE